MTEICMKTELGATQSFSVKYFTVTHTDMSLHTNSHTTTKWQHECRCIKIFFKGLVSWKNLTSVSWAVFILRTLSLL